MSFSEIAQGAYELPDTRRNGDVSGKVGGDQGGGEKKIHDSRDEGSIYEP
jgi:hypothetical protein